MLTWSFCHFTTIYYLLSIIWSPQAAYATILRMERYFNTAGPCVPGLHYMIPALERLPEAGRLIDRKQSFVIHAARQSGKTTAIMALVSEINAKGEKRAVYFTLESAQRYPKPKSPRFTRSTRRTQGRSSNPRPFPTHGSLRAGSHGLSTRLRRNALTTCLTKTTRSQLRRRSLRRRRKRLSVSAERMLTASWNA